MEVTVGEKRALVKERREKKKLVLAIERDIEAIGGGPQIGKC